MITSKLRAVIVDDEKHCIEILKIELKANCPEVEVIGVADSGKEGIALINKLKPDLVFLDIEMPLMTGFDLIQNLDKIDFDLVFVTAYDQYALKAFRFSAIDYLLKPLDSLDLKKAVDKIISRSTPKVDDSQIDFLLNAIKSKTNNFQKVGLPVGNKVEFVKVQEIIRCQSDGNYCKVFLENDRQLLMTKTLKNVELLLSEFGFLRIHNSHLINPKFVSSYEKAERGVLTMDDGTKINVTRYSRKELLGLI